MIRLSAHSPEIQRPHGGHSAVRACRSVQLGRADRGEQGLHVRIHGGELRRQVLQVKCKVAAGSIPEVRGRGLLQNRAEAFLAEKHCKRVHLMTPSQPLSGQNTVPRLPEAPRKPLRHWVAGAGEHL